MRQRAWALALFALASCASSSSGSSTPEPSASPQTAAAIPEGSAYVATNEELFAIAPDGTVTVIADVITRDIQIAPDGAAYVVTADAIGKVEGGRLVQVAPLPEQSFHHVVVQSPENIWAVQPSALQRFDGKAWRVFPAAELIDGMQLTLTDIAIDAEGAMWLVTRDSGLFRNNGRGWTKSLLTAAKDPLTLLPSSDGGIWLGAREAVQHVTVSSVDTVHRHELRSARVAAIDVTAQGDWAFVSTENVENKVVVHATWGKDRTQTREIELPVDAWPLVAMEVDRSGRLWAASAKGVTIVPPQGPPTEVELAANATNGDRIATLAIDAGGPRKLPSQLGRPDRAPGTDAPPARPELDATLEVVKGLQPAFKLCHTDPNLLGRVSITAQIDGAGAVVSAVATENKAVPTGVVECLLAAVKGAKFPPPGGGGTTVVIPIALIPSK